MPDHFCSVGGWVVGADMFVPEDPSDYAGGASTFGCNRLRCGACGEWVRQRAGVDCPGLPGHLAALYDTDDWTTLPFVRRFRLGRLYVCRCTGWLETSMHATGDPSPDAMAGDPSLPWGCAGHPTATLPLVVDGHRIDATTDLDALVARVLGGWSPDTGPPPTSWSPHAWLNRLRRRLADLPAARSIGAAVARHLDDPVLRGGAIAYFCGYPRDPGFDRLLALAADPAKLHAKTPDRPKQGPSYPYWLGWAVRCRLFSVRGEPDGDDREALRILEESFLRGDAGLVREDLDAIERVDAPWIASHAAGIARADRTRTVMILDGLRDRSTHELLAIAGVALAHEPAADQDAIREWLGHWSNRNKAYAAVIAAAQDTAAAERRSHADRAIDDLAHLLARVGAARRAVAWDGAADALPDLHVAARLVMDTQPFDRPGRQASQEALDALLAWAVARGASWSPSLRLRATERGARVEATVPLAAGADLVDVPGDLLVRTSHLLASHPTLAPWLAGDPPFGPGTLMLWLVVSRWGGGPPDPWAPYLRALPGVVPDTALSWPRSPGRHLLAHTVGDRFLTGVLRLYCQSYWRLQATEEARRPLPLEAFTLARWLWAGAIVSSRQNRIDGDLALIPLWDLLDHDERLDGPNFHHVRGAVRCVAGRAYAAGDAVGMFYGQRPPTVHWVYGGFAPPGPPDGPRPAVPFPLPATAPLRRDKLVWLLAQDEPVEVVVAPGDLDAALRRARWYALDHAELDRLGLSSVADAWTSNPALSPEGEDRARGMLRAWLLERAGPLEPEEPFSATHARVLTGAHAFYARLASPGR